MPLPNFFKKASKKEVKKTEQVSNQTSNIAEKTDIVIESNSNTEPNLVQEKEDKCAKAATKKIIDKTPDHSGPGAIERNSPAECENIQQNCDTDNTKEDGSMKDTMGKEIEVKDNQGQFRDDMQSDSLLQNSGVSSTPSVVGCMEDDMAQSGHETFNEPLQANPLIKVPGKCLSEDISTSHYSIRCESTSAISDDLNAGDVKKGTGVLASVDKENASEVDEKFKNYDKLTNMDMDLKKTYEPFKEDNKDEISNKYELTSEDDKMEENIKQSVELIHQENCLEDVNDQQKISKELVITSNIKKECLKELTGTSHNEESKECNVSNDKKLHSQSTKTHGHRPSFELPAKTNETTESQTETLLPESSATVKEQSSQCFANEADGTIESKGKDKLSCEQTVGSDLKLVMVSDTVQRNETCVGNEEKATSQISKESQETQKQAVVQTTDESLETPKPTVVRTINDPKKTKNPAVVQITNDHQETQKLHAVRTTNELQEAHNPSNAEQTNDESQTNQRPTADEAPSLVGNRTRSSTITSQSSTIGEDTEQCCESAGISPPPSDDEHNKMETSILNKVHEICGETRDETSTVEAADVVIEETSENTESQIGNGTRDKRSSTITPNNTTYLQDDCGTTPLDENCTSKTSEKALDIMSDEDVLLSSEILETESLGEHSGVGDSSCSLLTDEEILENDEQAFQKSDSKNWKVGYLQVKLPTKSRKAKLKAWNKRFVVIQSDEFSSDSKSPSLMLSVYHSESGNSRRHSALLWRSISSKASVVYRTMSKTHPYAFTISDVTEPVLHLAGDSESATQEWIAAIRAILWPPNPVMQLEKVLNGNEFEISVVDNSFSFRAGLLGTYGYLTVTSRKLILTHPQSGHVIQEWYLNTVDKFRILPQTKEADINKVIIMQTSSDSSTGCGEIKLFCNEAIDFLKSVAATIHKVLQFHSKESNKGYEKELAEMANWLTPQPSPTVARLADNEDYYKIPPRQVRSLLDIPNFIFDLPTQTVAVSSALSGHRVTQKEVEPLLKPSTTCVSTFSQDSGISMTMASDDFLNCSSTSFTIGSRKIRSQERTSSGSESSDCYTPPRSPNMETLRKTEGKA